MTRHRAGPVCTGAGQSAPGGVLQKAKTDKKPDASDIVGGRFRH